MKGQVFFIVLVFESRLPFMCTVGANTKVADLHSAHIPCYVLTKYRLTAGLIFQLQGFGYCALPSWVGIVIQYQLASLETPHVQTVGPQSNTNSLYSVPFGGTHATLVCWKIKKTDEQSHSFQSHNYVQETQYLSGQWFIGACSWTCTNGSS